MQQSSDNSERDSSIIDYCKQHNTVTAAAVIKNLLTLSTNEHSHPGDIKEKDLATTRNGLSASSNNENVKARTSPKYHRLLVATAALTVVLALGLTIFSISKEDTSARIELPKITNSPPEEQTKPRSKPKEETAVQPSQQQEKPSVTSSSELEFSTSTSASSAKRQISEIEGTLPELKKEYKESQDRAERIRKAEERIARAKAELESFNKNKSGSNSSLVSSNKSRLSLKSNEPADVASYLKTLLYYRSNGFNYALSDLYAPKTRFRVYGSVSRSDIHNYYEREKKQWPEQEYSLLGNPSILSSDSESLNVRYTTKFSRTPTNGGDAVSGTETLELMLKVSGDGTLLIEKEIKK